MGCLDQQKFWPVPLIIAGDNLFPTSKKCLSFQKYAVFERVVVKVSFYIYSEVLSEYAKKSGVLEKCELWN